jgi:hypothetical protein
MPDYTPPSGGAGGGGSPTGGAGGYLAGSSPNPTLADAAITIPSATPDSQGYLTWTYDPFIATGTTSTANYAQNGILYTHLVSWPYTGKAITAIDCYIVAAAVGATTGQNFLAVYGPAGGAAIASADAVAAFGGTGVRSVSIAIAAGSLPSTGPGTYIYVGLLSNAATSVATYGKMTNPVTALANLQNRANTAPRNASFGTGATTAVPSLTVASASGTGQNGTVWFGVR